MDGSSLAWLASHPFVTSLAAIGIVGLTYALVRHTQSCKLARKELHDISRELLAKVSGLEGYVKGKLGEDK